LLGYQSTSPTPPCLGAAPGGYKCTVHRTVCMIGTRTAPVTGGISKKPNVCTEAEHKATGRWWPWLKGNWLDVISRRQHSNN
jgi:hypothetical protein